MLKYEHVDGNEEHREDASSSQGDVAHFEVDTGGDLPEEAAERPWCLRLCMDIVESPRNVVNFYSRLSRRFSWRFVAMVSVVYGINQGLGEGWYFFATDWYLSSKPPEGIGLPADRMQSVLAFANIPWQVKSIYGILSDTFSICGYRRMPYLVIAGTFGVVAWLWLAIGAGYSIWVTAMLLGMSSLMLGPLWTVTIGIDLCLIL